MEEGAEGSGKAERLDPNENPQPSEVTRSLHLYAKYILYLCGRALDGIGAVPGDVLHNTASRDKGCPIGKVGAGRDEHSETLKHLRRAHAEHKDRLTILRVCFCVGRHRKKKID